MTACRCTVQWSTVRLNPFRVYARPSADQHGHRLLITMERRVMEERFAIGAALHNRVDLNTTTLMSCCRPPPPKSSSGQYVAVSLAVVEIGRKSFVLAVLDVLHNSLRHRRLLHVSLACRNCCVQVVFSPPRPRNHNLLELSRTNLNLPKQFQQRLMGKRKRNLKRIGSR